MPYFSTFDNSLQRYNDIAILIDYSPEIMLDSVELHKHFIDIECITKTITLSLQSFGELWAELVTPQSDGFVADFNTAFGQ